MKFNNIKTKLLLKNKLKFYLLALMRELVSLSAITLQIPRCNRHECDRLVRALSNLFIIISCLEIKFQSSI